MSLWITGTGTEVGKTTVSALVACRYGWLRAIRYWKPLATGGNNDSDTRTVATLAAGAVRVLLPRYVYDPPVSPHWAGRLAGKPIEAKVLDAAWQTHASEPGPLLVEGAGGVMVPLNDAGLLSVDWFARLGLPALVVAKSTLGTLNHTLLTVEALRRRHVAVVGVVLNGPPHPDNASSLERFGAVPVLGHLPLLNPCNPTTLQAAARQFDPQGRLQPWLSHG